MNRIPSHTDEPYYDIPLINDIHMHFPDLLYDIDRFESVRDVLEYVRDRIAARYDRFSNAEQRYTENRNPVRLNRGGGGGGASARAAATLPPRAPPLHASLPHMPTQTPPAPQRAAATAQATLNNIATMPLYTTRINMNDIYIPTNAFTIPPLTPLQQQQQEMDNATALLTLLGMLGGPFGTGPLGTGSLEPIIVRPSAEIIRASTTLETLQEDRSSEELCVICQEGFSSGDQIRQIHHCRHTFHNTCILQHFENSVRCPTCRHDIRDSTEETN